MTDYKNIIICTGCGLPTSKTATSCCDAYNPVPLLEYLAHSMYVPPRPAAWDPHALHKLGIKHGTDKATAHQYCDFYQENLINPADFTGALLEIGVKDGASLRMWRDYYPKAQIYGIDINPPIKVPGCIVLQMDQTDISALAGLPEFDLIIDDGSHMTLHQIISLHYLWHNKLSDIGAYVMEDVHTSRYTAYINSARTTLDYLVTFPAFDKKDWCRVPDKSDSHTIILYK